MENEINSRKPVALLICCRVYLHPLRRTKPDNPPLPKHHLLLNPLQQPIDKEIILKLQVK